jgi:hypothetical protein
LRGHENLDGENWFPARTGQLLICARNPYAG